ncbi:MAG: D-alanyl-D-alanine carboxypeptidase [Rhizobiaceae bacterium]|nr:D-alanyl-D-alanine carboxypeptidase [Rhizobiaceae bacterium]
MFDVLSFRGNILRFAVALLALLLLSACTTTEAMQSVEPSALTSTENVDDSPRHAVAVVDATSGRMLYSMNANALRHPASLTKMMTLYLLFEALESHRVNLFTMIPVSDHAARQPPTNLRLRAGDQIDVLTAIHALTVKSANDVAVAVGEYLGGSEEQFAAMMTAKARAIGMRNTTFRNASGLHDPEQVTTARDMALLGISLRRRFPDKFQYFSATSFDFRGKLVRGHNDLLGRVDGVDGIKTGYVRASGFNIVTSVRSGGKSLVVVVMGGQTARIRDDEVKGLIATYMGQPSLALQP